MPSSQKTKRGLNKWISTDTLQTQDWIDDNEKIEQIFDGILGDDTIKVLPSVFGSQTCNKITDCSPSVEMQITGKHYVNHAMPEGSCEKTTNWAIYQATLATDETNKVFGTKSIKTTLTAPSGSASIIPTNLDKTKYYLMTAHLKNGNASHAQLGSGGTGTGSGGTGVVSPVVTTTSNFVRSGLKVQPSDWGTYTQRYLAVSVIGTSGQYAYIDGVQINEITAEEYANDSIDTLMTKYPYAEGLAVVTNPSATITHADGSKTQTVVEGRFFTGENPTVSNGKVTGTKLWREAVLFGKDYDWTLAADYIGFKAFKIPNIIGVATGYAGNMCERYDKKPIKEGTVSVVDSFTVWTDGYIYVSISDADSGLGESESTTNDMVKTIFNGWKKTGASTWVSMVDGTTVPTTQSIDFVKANVAPNFDGWKLAYKLATAEQMSDVDARVRGDIPRVEKGVNTIVVDNGIVLGEIAPFGYNTSNYLLNYSVVGGLWGDTRMKNKVEVFLKGYKNGVDDFSRWISTFAYDAYGKERMSIPIGSDMSATYTADYKILATQAPNIGTVTLSYKNGLQEVVADLQEQVNNLSQPKNPIQEINGRALFSGTSMFIRDQRITENTRVMIDPLTAKAGTWAGEAINGEFKITSSATETNVPFNWYAYI